IDVAPPNLPSLQVVVDDETLNTALVGVHRPINPGAHKLIVAAPGYGRKEETFSVKEREMRTVAVKLEATGGVVYSPAPRPARGAPPPAPTPAPAPPPTPPPYSPDGTPPPPGAQPTPEGWQVVKKPPRQSLLIGALGGVLFPAGGLRQGANGTADEPFSN